MLRNVMLACAAFAVTAVPAAAADDPQLLPSRPQQAEVMAAASGVPAPAWTCAPRAEMPDQADDSFRWRWTAYRHLECVVRVVEEALETRAGGEDGAIALSREELERIRAQALLAKDAAARIGR